jgi:hypothetical protein
VGGDHVEGEVVSISLLSLRPLSLLVLGYLRLDRASVLGLTLASYVEQPFSFALVSYRDKQMVRVKAAGLSEPP